MRERSVLVIDDDHAIRDMLREALEDAGYRVYDGENGWALGAALKHRPDCILLDLWMPVMSGWELRRELLDHATTAPIPVILMTALGNAAQWREDLQCAGLLAKPFEIGDMLTMVQEAIASREATGGD